MKAIENYDFCQQCENKFNAVDYTIGRCTNCQWEPFDQDQTKLTWFEELKYSCWLRIVIGLLIIIAMSIGITKCTMYYQEKRRSAVEITFLNCELIDLQIDDDAQAHIIWKDPEGNIKAESDLPGWDYDIIESDSTWIQIPICENRLATHNSPSSFKHAPVKIYITPDYEIEHITDSF